MTEALALFGDRAVDRRGVRPTDLGFLAFLVAALLPSSLIFLQLPNMSLSLAPLFYLLAYSRWGVLRGLVAALALSTPAAFLYQAVLNPVLAVGQIAFVTLLRRYRLMMAEAVFGYALLTAPLLAVLMMKWSGERVANTAVTQLECLFVQVLLAAAADALVQHFAVGRHFPYVVRRTNRSLNRILRSLTNFIVVLLFTVATVNQAKTQDRLELIYRDHVRDAVLDEVEFETKRSSKIDRLTDILLYDGTSVPLYISTDGKNFERRASARVGHICKLAPEIDRGAANRADIQWHSAACEIIPVRIGTTQIWTATSLRDALIHRYGWIDLPLIALLLGGVLALVYRIRLTQSLSRTLELVMSTVAKFGEPDLPPISRQPFREFHAPLRHFVERNNAFVAAVEDRNRLTRLALELKRSVDLRLMRDIRFDEASGALHFTEVRLTAEPLDRILQVHAADCGLFASAQDSDEATIEFRVAGAEEMEILLLTLRQNVGEGRWGSGITFRLRQPQRLNEMIQHHTRLVELGNMTATIGHELKQPLFTIAMAAETIQMLIDRHVSDTEEFAQLTRSAARIALQVDRAEEIIRRIAQYGRAKSEGASSDLVGALEEACSFMKPLLDAHAITVLRLIEPTRCDVPVPRVTLEQVVVNAIQNAVDAIESARESGRDAGRLTLQLRMEDAMGVCTIADDGVGLKAGVADTAFDAYFTTKAADKGSGLGLYVSRQIIRDAGGKIELSSAKPHGAELTLRLPVLPAEGNQSV